MNECCETCKKCLNIELYDYSEGGCKHTKVEDDFICLAFRDEGIACLMHGVSKKDKCECWEGKYGVWREVYGYCTAGGDPVWCCPKCRGSEHVYGIEHEKNYTHICKDCGQTNIYPWEKTNDT